MSETFGMEECVPRPKDSRTTNKNHLPIMRKGCHYMADVFDPREQCWLRYDGMDADGVGQPVRCTGGAVRHRGGRYYPIMVVYAREREA